MPNVSHDLYHRIDLLLRDLRGHEENARRALIRKDSDDVMFALLEVELAVQHIREAIADAHSPKRNFFRGDV